MLAWSPGAGVGVGVGGSIVNVSEGLSVDDVDDPAGVNRITIEWSPTDKPVYVVPVEPLIEQSPRSYAVAITIQDSPYMTENFLHPGCIQMLRENLSLVSD